MKRENEDQMDQENGQNGNNQSDNASKKRKEESKLRLLISSNVAGAIIGKGGANIKKLRADHNADVKVADCQGPERVITIGPDFDTYCSVLKDMLKHLDTGKSDEYELRVLLHQSLAGCVIGKGGSKIKELKDRIGCRLKIFPNTAPQSSDRVAQIIGSENQCMECLSEVINLMSETKIKGPINSYDPFNYDDMYADEYGGWGQGGNFGGDRGGRGGGGNNRQGGGQGSGNRQSGGGGGFGGDRGNNRGGNNMDRGNNRGGGGGGGNMNRDFVDPWARNGNNMGGGGGGMFGGGNNNNFGGNNNMGGGNMGSGSGNNMGGGNNMGSGNLGGGNMGGGNSGGNNSLDMDGKTSTQVTIPKDMAGSIIGKGGNRIRRIRQESNAFIQIDEALQGSNDRIITITGTPREIQTAQYMLQSCIREGGK